MELPLPKLGELICLDPNSMPSNVHPVGKNKLAWIYGGRITLVITEKA